MVEKGQGSAQAANTPPPAMPGALLEVTEHPPPHAAESQHNGISSSTQIEEVFE